MTNHPLIDDSLTGEHGQPLRVLFSFAGRWCGTDGRLDSPFVRNFPVDRELSRLAASVEPGDMQLCRAADAQETLNRVEAGGLSGAVVYAGPRREGLELLSLIRAIDDVLPCWLVTPQPTRQVLEAALALRVASVFAAPLDPDIFIAALRRTLIGPPYTN